MLTKLFASLLVFTPVIVFGAKANQVSSAEVKYAYFNSVFASEFNNDGAKFTGDNDTRQGWYTSLQKNRAENKKQLRLMAVGADLCVGKSGRQICWKPAPEDKNMGIKFYNGKVEKIFRPTNLTDREATEKELRKFMNGQAKRAGLFDIFINQAQAADEGLSKTVDPSGYYLRSFNKVYPGVVVASATGWKFLADHPSQESIKNFSKNVKELSKDFSKNSVVQCNPVSTDMKLANGDTARIRMFPAGNTLYTVHAADAKEGEIKAVYRPEFKDAGKGDAPGTFKSVLNHPWGDILTYEEKWVPTQRLHVIKCPLNKVSDCEKVTDFGFSYEYGIAKKDIDDMGTFSGQKAPANQDGEAEFDANLKRHIDKTQETMLKMREMQMACQTPEIREAAAANGVKFDTTEDALTTELQKGAK